jgi:hypothetical protein
MTLAHADEVEVMAEDKSGETRAQITVVMPPDLLDWLKVEAGRKGIKPSALLRMWALERREQQEREARP